MLRVAAFIVACLCFTGLAAAATGPGPDSRPISPESTAPIVAEVAGFSELVGSGKEKLLYQQGQAMALAWLANVGELDKSLRALVGIASESLALARFQVAANAQGDLYCAKLVASLFVVQTIPDTIFVCADTRWHVQQDDGPVTAVLAQGFVHEAVHLAGTTDECLATRLEIAVARNNIGAFSPGNLHRYASQCAGLLDGVRGRN